MLPLIRAGDVRSLMLHLFGIPILLFGTGLFVWGGIVFVRRTLNALANEGFRQRVGMVESGGLPDPLAKARRQNLRVLWEAWKPGLGWLALGFALIALGGFVINR